MAKKDGMYFYNDWLAPFEKLEKREVGELVVAMMRYFIYGEEPPEFSGLCGMAADFIFPQIDRSMEYANLGSRAKGVAKTKRTGKPLHIEVEKEESLNAEEDFEVFWDCYPNKTGKQQARDAFLKLSPDGALLEKIISAVNAQKMTDRWQKEGGRYVPYPANWLEGKRWEDETEPPKAPIPAETSFKSFDNDDFFLAAVRKYDPSYNPPDSV